MLGILIAAALCVTVRNLFHSAVFLAFTLIGIAMLYFFLQAEFIAAMQILLYVGAIMTLIVFAVMLTSRMGNPAVPQSFKNKKIVFLPLGLVGFILISAILKTPWETSEPQTAVNAVTLGKALMNQYVFPFEVVSLVLLVALIGAIVIARSE
ncbi:MAG: hypothetical protein A3G33_09635 [Omnitrophica bacterium RIFCSPLOWO2_12_FULL_44_17]|uniref:NADH-quinone oxidoreductase subunit J n=1 Tax=Candidatus Danuiimicrobium aquiferis TaxID=1801832 RepID=A0A1G1KX34_9BACT|nr:MAG: hypothetical protein A3B72_09725 [Omnitrophica bacterium RIFCSPHIGHO2_02_FULL_45_28]OGW89639.1 MAG: hypothetical protein A3E74_05080 [Omnitrophica bacterium RIFCSPHIGHO2_12_FULL_44_12]OGW97490.1 MAG: hypothetical protein A3G33_09635 [Omnitrophica bacterium RIFCSPLOWO2_12_FULL_44_17]OGX04542.1 MAG: hypothetical protein A3J12_10675 [Omnitrophica bacterium RIFCSPLOWO2_02_FULL_44_11]